MIILSQFRPILVITVWDVVCLLWTYHINRPPQDKMSGPNCIFGENVETSCRQDHRNGGELACSPNHSKPHIFGSETEDSEIFLRGQQFVVGQQKESDSCRMATSLCLDLQTEDPEENTKMELQCYVMDVKQFGFNHIIIIGKRYCGMLFMDCFGRVFDWDSDGHALWSLGDYFDIISKEESEKNYDDRTAWDVLRDGTVFVLHKYVPGEFDISSIMDDIKKKTKKKKKKGRH
ncbi:hypothetical protein C2G38_2239238 [Gigaspora rosea]|uniref:Uncharacterized protein n=1 Tax=Gigaspora rosea TaxID=44941 RepID=A0A397W2C7_9GLOM|nr:hypothetical protein C2G38_2239238 [Gigaspora rosea]